MPRTFDTFRITATLPDELAPLYELAYNLHWSWDHETIALFRRLDRDLWNSTSHNPVKMLGTVKQDTLSQAVRDEGFMDQMYRSHHRLKEHLMGKTWFEDKYGRQESPKMLLLILRNTLKKEN